MLKLGLRNVVGSRPPAIAPPVPTDVVITVVSDTAFSIAYVSAFPVEFWYSTTEGGVYTKHGDSASTPYAMTGLTAGTKYWVKPRAVNGSKYSAFGSAVSATTYAPYFSDALFLLNGDIVTVGESIYFQDKTANARNFLITGYDFDSTWTKGFPYKSAATISAPAADAALIAADINNYLYDSGGTPNQIPVVSLFQDIDYEHKLFCKHLPQVVDVNGVETFEPRIVDIVLYANVKATTELTLCNSYYGVPVEDANAKWVSLSGDDATGDGSKSTPWKTLIKAATTAGTNIIIYIKSGNYVESAALELGVGQIFTFVGLSTVSNSSTPSYTISTKGNNSSVVGAMVDGQNVDGTGIGDTLATGVIIDRCLLKNNKTYATRPDKNTNSITKNCVYLTSSLSTYLIEFRASNTAKDLMISGTFAGRIFSNQTIAGQTANILNNKLILLSTNNPICRFGSGTLNFIDNNIIASQTGILFQPVTGNQAGVVNIKNNKFKITTIPSNFFANISATQVYDFYFYDNELIVTTFNTIQFQNQGIIEFLRNKIISTNAIANGGKYFYGVSTLTSINFSYNVLHAKVLLGWGCLFGLETADLSFPIISNGNKILGSKYFDDNVTRLNAPHAALFVWRSLGDSEFMYNYIDGCMLGIVFKGLGTTGTKSDISYNVSKNQLLAKGQNGVTFYNNTIINNYSDDCLIRIMNNNSTSEPSSACKIKNNILIFKGTGTTYSISIENDECLLNFESDYNIFYSINEDLIFNYKGTDKTFSEWQALGYDTHSIVLTDEQFNGLFTDFANGDYSLKAGSVAIGSGVDLGAAYDDGLDSSTDWGSDTELSVVVTKQQGAAWDIGAYVH